jgi:hypothetical protein
MSSESPRSALSWIFIIAFGILLGNGLNSLTDRLYTQYRLGHFPSSLEELGRLFNQSVASTPEERKRRQQERKTQTQLEGNCGYWEDQVAQKDNAQNRAFRDMACARAKGMFR